MSDYRASDLTMGLVRAGLVRGMVAAVDHAGIKMVERSEALDTQVAGDRGGKHRGLKLVWIHPGMTKRAGKRARLAMTE